MKKAFFAALPLTMPILAGFWFLGVSYGIYMQNLGFSFCYPMLMSLLIFAGSMEFVTAALLLGPFQPFSALLLTILVNARHLFYGLAMLEPYRGTGAVKPYLIFGMCDETFSINCGAMIPPGIDRKWFYFFVTLLNHVYWVTGATLGGLCGGWLALRWKGLDFVMTALFTVILIEQLRKERNFLSAALGLAISGLALALLGKTAFMIPAMTGILLAVTLCRPVLERRKGAQS